MWLILLLIFFYHSYIVGLLGRVVTVLIQIYLLVMQRFVKYCKTIICSHIADKVNLQFSIALTGMVYHLFLSIHCFLILSLLHSDKQNML